MSIFDVEEKRLIEQEKEQAEIIASNEYQKELDEAKQIVRKRKQSALKVKVRNGRRKICLFSNYL